MATCSYFDLLWEVEKVSADAVGKVVSFDNYEQRGEDEDDALPSKCVFDKFMSEALLGNPFLPLPAEDELLPPASPRPETLMPVSLPAGQPAAPATSPPRPPSPAPSSPPELSTPQVSPPASPQPFTGPSSEAPTTPRSPVRVVVTTGRMVAPATFEKSSRFLVRVPGPAHLPPTTPTRHLSLQEEEKPEPATPTTPAPEAPPAQASPPSEARSPTPDTTTTTLRSLPSRCGARRRWCSSSSSTSSTISGSSTPFRSLRGGGGCSGARPDNPTKRKAYELEPQEDPDMERCRQNAINAKRNREQKKARLAELEKRVEEGDRERDRLIEKNRELQEGMAELQREVKHLTNILRNQSRLSDILGKLASAGGSRSSRQVGRVHP